jgi:hypothetical protein
MSRKTRIIFIFALVLAVGLSALYINAPIRVKAAGNGAPTFSTFTPATQPNVSADGVAVSQTMTVNIRDAANVAEVGDQINIGPNP